MTAPAEHDSATLARIQRRTVLYLSIGQILGGIGLGSTVSLGALLAESVSGSAAWSGMAATMSTLGAASAAIPLAYFARVKGRRPALSVGAFVAAVGTAVTVMAVGIDSFPLLLVSFLLIGFGLAVGLQARFAAADLASAAHRGRDLSLVVWATTIGAVAGPNLIGPGDQFGRLLGMPTLTGPYLLTFVAFTAAGVIYEIGLRPDPLRLRQHLDFSAHPAAAAAVVGSPVRAVFAIVTLSLSTATMVAVMAMTPVHLRDEGAMITIIGLVISVHIAGMYSLAPVFGVLADHLGRIPTILIGQVVFGMSLLTLANASHDKTAVTIGLILLGLGWSASTVAASALVTESVEVSRRAIVQGRSDLIMNLTAATAGASSGVVLALIGYAGLALAAGVLVLSVVAFAGVLRLTGR